MPDALIVDDDPGFTPAIKEFMEEHAFTVTCVRTLREAYAEMESGKPDLLLVDLILPDGSGLDLISGASDGTRVLVITGHPTVDRAVESLRAKVDDFLIKPLDLGRLEECLDSLAPPGKARASAPRPAQGPDYAPFGYLVGRSEPMQALYRLIERAAPSDATVLLRGESGTGKELVAKALHDLSPRAKGPFLAVNCGALPSNLIGSELFGHERGSFTGATRQHRGYFERAVTGTLLLDEVSEMPLELQVQLLRVLEAGTLRRLGGERDVRVDVRVVAATNQDLETALAEGRFREDLYFRLAILPIELPPLRERGGDVVLLANHFLALLNQQQGAEKWFTAAALERLTSHVWPGNVRELRNAVQRAFILADDTIDAEHLPRWREDGREDDARRVNLAVGTSIDDAERRLILATLEHFQGDKPKTAESLGISLKTLYNRLKQYQRERNHSTP